MIEFSNRFHQSFSSFDKIAQRWNKLNVEFQCFAKLILFLLPFQTVSHIVSHLSLDQTRLRSQHHICRTHVQKPDSPLFVSSVQTNTAWERRHGRRSTPADNTHGSNIRHVPQGARSWDGKWRIEGILEEQEQNRARWLCCLCHVTHVRFSFAV